MENLTQDFNEELFEYKKIFYKYTINSGMKLREIVQIDAVKR
jgi:hypothetical protein